MPHPERAMSTLLGSADGVVLFESFLGVKAATPALAH
jgi:phosphoribosylformylglycinamidine (FGAM) synthase-like amidotransferase family enzyme